MSTKPRISMSTTPRISPYAVCLAIVNYTLKEHDKQLKKADKERLGKIQDQLIAIKLTYGSDSQPPLHDIKALFSNIVPIFFELTFYNKFAFIAHTSLLYVWIKTAYDIYDDKNFLQIPHIIGKRWKNALYGKTWTGLFKTPLVSWDQFLEEARQNERAPNNPFSPLHQVIQDILGDCLARRERNIRIAYKDRNKTEIETIRGKFDSINLLARGVDGNVVFLDQENLEQYACLTWCKKLILQIDKILDEIKNDHEKYEDYERWEAILTQVWYIAAAELINESNVLDEIPTTDQSNLESNKGKEKVEVRESVMLEGEENNKLILETDLYDFMKFYDNEKAVEKNSKQQQENNREKEKEKETKKDDNEAKEQNEGEGKQQEETSFLALYNKYLQSLKVQQSNRPISPRNVGVVFNLTQS